MAKDRPERDSPNEAVFILGLASARGMLSDDEAEQWQDRVRSLPSHVADGNWLVREGALSPEQVERLRQDRTRHVPAFSPVSTPSEANPSSTPRFPEGTIWGKYLLEKRLGYGGQSEVYQAYDRTGLMGHVALKVPREQVAEAQVQQWLEKEVAALADLDHPNIVKVLDAGSIEKTPYVATELIRGEPLSQHVRLRPPSDSQILDWTIRLAQAVEAAHDLGVAHRDLKPHNVIVTEGGDPKIIDFGIAGIVTAYIPERPSGSSGTVPFMAPEQARGTADADHRVDVFGLGGLLKFLLTGFGPYEPVDEKEDLRRLVLDGSVRLIETEDGKGLRRALVEIANRAMAPNPEERYRNAGEMLSALKRLETRRFLVRRAPMAILAAAALALLLFAVLHKTPAPVSAELEIRLLRDDQPGAYRVLDENCLPLRVGDRIRIHARLSEPLYAYLLEGNRTDGIRLVWPDSGVAESRVSEFSVPARPNEAFELDSPPTTETLILIGCRKPVSDPRALIREIESLGEVPTVNAYSLLVLEEGGARVIENTEIRRTLNLKTVVVEPGLLDRLRTNVPGKWAVVKAVSFAHREP